MRTLWLKIWLWTKAVIAALALIYVLVFVAQNSGVHVKFWVWHNVEPEESVLVLALYAFLAGAVAMVAGLTAFRTVRQVRELRERARKERIEKEHAEMYAKAGSLQTKPVPGSEPPPPVG